jgi:hypothetical protein
MNRDPDGYYTPKPIIELARFLMGDIDLDPASCEEANQTIQAKQIYTKEQDGLKLPWRGRVFFAPPHSAGKCQEWIQRGIKGVESGEITHLFLMLQSWAKIPSEAPEPNLTLANLPVRCYGSDNSYVQDFVNVYYWGFLQDGWQGIADELRHMKRIG